MRVLGFTKKWEKLQNPEFTTFRFPRKDKDWRIGESVQIVYHPRSNKDREIICTARIIIMDAYMLRPTIGYLYPTEEEAVEDGFTELSEMLEFFFESYGNRIFSDPINKLTLERV